MSMLLVVVTGLAVLDLACLTWLAFEIHRAPLMDYNGETL